MPNQQLDQTQQPRLPQIDPATFPALNVLDGFIARAPLTRQEHAEANRSLQHLVQTLEILQATVREYQNGPSRATQPLTASASGNGAPAPDGNGAVHTGKPAEGGAVVAEAAEEIFRNAR